MAKLLITGASGFVGQALLKQARLRHECVGLTRADNALLESDLVVHEMDDHVDFSDVLTDVDVVIHCAGIAHRSASSADYDRVNVRLTVHLANQAVRNGVSRFIFLSTAKVQGEYSEPECLWNEEMPSKPVGDYAKSKQTAEQELQKIGCISGMEIVILRPPLVYGPKVTANFSRLLSLVYKQVPLPLGSIKNQRSLIFLDNLVDIILLCIEHPNAANQIFFVSDDQDLSSPELLKQLAMALSVPSRLWAISPLFLFRIGKVLKQEAAITALCSSLQLDISKAKTILHWQPPISQADGLSITAQDFLTSRSA